MIHRKRIRLSIHVCLDLATAAAVLLVQSSGTLYAQPVVGRVFPATEFAARRERLLKSIGDEDMLLVTRAGYRNMSGFVPIEIPAIERMMQRHGLSDAALADSLAGR